MNKQKTAIIIGAGPAGLTASLELLRRTEIKPIIFEASADNGGISKTIKHNGNCIDIGGHRFFSKSERIMRWWLDILPLQGVIGEDNQLDISYHNKSRSIELKKEGPDPDLIDDVMLVRNRISRIYYSGKLFNYPLSLDITTVRNLGVANVVKIGLSYIWSQLVPIRDEKSLEDFFINRFGRKLYATFFQDYTEKVWGIPCSEISAEWGAQRIKGLSISKTVIHAVKQRFSKDRSLGQKDVETSLIEHFMYPKYGPGHMWDTVARKITELGGEIHYNTRVENVCIKEGLINKVVVKDAATGRARDQYGNYVFSTMPVRELINGFEGSVPENVKRVANGLVYRDFITIGLLLDNLAISDKHGSENGSNLVSDNWIYIQEPNVKIGRLQIFNNWSPYMVRDAKKVWIGLEYFCDEGDELWTMSDDEIVALARNELDEIHITRDANVLDSIVIRMPKTYPAYFGTYNEMDKIRAFVDPIENLFLIGRNGMHKYNNQDHSMLTAIEAVENIINGQTSKNNIWDVNTEMEYHEDKS
ncbi:MAG TPA: NAD(P)/FAD-dependent oxidoreductase [Acidiferrobacteraceae bacterium]|nr:NAD(P)/FAD-dependent oxidoreductase [Acidiferrobacteraceae bacterium]